LTEKILTPLILSIWFAVWSIGGILIAARVFNFRREKLILGISLGLVLQLWFSNWMAYLMPVPYSFWIGALIVLLFGLYNIFPLKIKNLRVSAPRRLKEFFVPILILFFLIYLFTSIGRGLNIFDDFQNLPVTSIMAAGDIPPHFPFDPGLRFGYHYLLLLFSAQLMRLGDLFPWTAMDIARAIPLALLLMLAHLWTRRFTRSQFAGFLGAAFVAFSGGARWLLLLLPSGFVESISQHIGLMGSGIPTAPDLATAMTSIWKIEGDGPIKFPFAYANGINPPASMSHGGIGVMGILVFLLLIILARRLRNYKTGFIFAAVFASYALTGEYTFLIVYPSIGLALLIHWIRTRRLNIPRSFLPALVVGSVSLIFVLFQGGVLTEAFRGIFARSAEQESFHTFTFALSVPSFVSAHLGVLNLLNPYQLIVAIFEVGPAIFVLPLLFIWGLRMVRAGQWWEAGVAASAFLSILSLFVKYTGTAGESANTRLLATLTIPPTLYTVPLVCIWLKRRSEQMKIAVSSIGFIAIFGGLVFFGIQLIAIQKPTLPLFITELDARMEKRHWNQLAPGTMIFDPNPLRVVTVFGRATDAMTSWTPKDEWAALVDNPDPRALNAAGYDYVYFGIEYWDELSKDDQKGLQDACVKLADEVQGIRSPNDYRKDFRRLLDITDCK
jgi:hypothetical protein